MKVALWSPRRRRHVAGLQAARISSRMPNRLLPAFHSASERSRYFSVTISRIGPTFCAMPPWTSTRLSCELAAGFRGDLVVVRMRWLGSSRPRLMPNSGSPSPACTPSISLMPGQTPPESCQPPPEPPSHSPRIAPRGDDAGARLPASGR